jgi:hypothetical protein
LGGRNGTKLHLNNIAFLKEFEDEAGIQPGGMVPGYSCCAFVQGSLKDVFDAVQHLQLLSDHIALTCIVSAQIVCLDCVDDGFSFFVCIPGQLPAMKGPLKVDCYVPTHELAHASCSSTSSQ